MEPNSIDNTTKTTPKDFFLHLGTIVALYVSVTSFLALIFQVIDYKFRDNLYGFYDPYASGMKISISSLVIMFPIFILLSWLLEKEYSKFLEKRGLGVRRWLIYITLFIAGLTLAIDLIVLINTFLGGEITTRFFLKVLFVFIVAGAVFGYYIFDLLRGVGEKKNIVKTFVWAAAIAVIAAIVGGFIFVGSPGSQRAVRMDSTRVNDLETIQSEIITFWQSKEKLPAKISDLKNSVSGFVPSVDPENNNPYEYKTTGQNSFELCANFTTENKNNLNVEYGAPNYNWQHGKGRFCFERTIDPELYPPFQKPISMPKRIPQ